MFALLLAFAAALLQPAASPTNLSGIWEGSIGTLPVRACFVEREYGTFGAYYYLSHLQLIGLEAEDGTPGGYREAGEDAGDGHWRDVRATADALTARWTSGSRTLPVRLRRIAGAAGETGACADPAFHRPRLAGVHTVSSRATLDGTAYTKLRLDTAGHFNIAVETFALDGDSAAVRRINGALGADLAGDPPSWLQCATDSLDSSGREGQSSDALAPAMISRRWLSVAGESDWDCGGAHPDESHGYRLFDLGSGAEVELLDWFLPSAVKREHFEGTSEDSRTLEPAFRTFHLAGWHASGEREECGEVVREAEYWNAGLTREGITFSPSLPHVVAACGEPITLSFDRLRRWLTPEGLAAVAALQAERR